MDFAGLNYIAILAAAVAGFAFGSVWYMALSKPWMAAVGKTEDEIKATMTAGPFILAFVMQLVMAWVLAGVIGHLGQEQVTFSNGVISGGFVWFGFVMTTLVVNHAYQGARRALTVIDGLHWLGVLVVQGAVIGLFGV